MENPSIQALPLGVIRSNACLAAAVTREEVQRWKEVFARHGALTPLIVRPSSDGGYVVVAGARELEAVRELQAHSTEAVVVPLPSETEAHKLSLQLLCLRSSPNPLEEALIIQAILQDAQVSQTDLAKLCGHSLSWVSKRLHLVDSLQPAVIELVSRRVLAPATAQEIARLPPRSQAPFARRVVAEGIAKSVVEQVVSLYNAPQTTEELRCQLLAAPVDALARIQEGAAKLGRPQPQGDEDLRFREGCRLLQRLLGQISDLLPTAPPTEGQSLLIARMEQLTGQFLARLQSLTEGADFPQGKWKELP